MSKIGLVFPGQGSQFVGMGKALLESSPAAKEIFKKADDVLGMALSEIIFSGPEDVLKKTENAQPAILTASVAAWEGLKEKSELDFNNCICAGHSLGEYSALVVAGVLDFETAVKLVRERGQYMQDAASSCDGGMAAVMGKSEAEVNALCKEADDQNGIQVANLNSPGQIVVSGSKKALEAFLALAAEQKAKVIPLAVSGPFHSTYMQPAAEKLNSSFSGIDFKKAAMPVVVNVSAQLVTDPKVIQESLLNQVTGSVRWEDSMNKMIAEGVTEILEIGPGRVLRGLMKKINRGIPSTGVFEPAEIDAVSQKHLGIAN